MKGGTSLSAAKGVFAQTATVIVYVSRVAEEKMLLKEKGDAKDAKKPIVAVSRFSR